MLFEKFSKKFCHICWLLWNRLFVFFVRLWQSLSSTVCPSNIHGIAIQCHFSLVVCWMYPLGDLHIKWVQIMLDNVYLYWMFTFLIISSFWESDWEGARHLLNSMKTFYSIMFLFHKWTHFLILAGSAFYQIWLGLVSRHAYQGRAWLSAS